MKALVINSGSSSIKFKLFDAETERVLARGAATRIGEPQPQLELKWLEPSGVERSQKLAASLTDHHTALDSIVSALARTRLLKAEELGVVGHRVVHGGERFTAPTVVTDEVAAAIDRMSALAPLHNPANLEGIEVSRQRFADVPSVAVFDTAFHQTMPEAAFLYALPQGLREELGVRRYGFHGTSHAYVSKRVAARMGRAVDGLNLITLHLGNGASACAIEGGRSVDTSMGMTPLGGLVMGTRSGDVDPGVVFYLAREKGLSLEELDRLLNRDSGLVGLSADQDMRSVRNRADLGDSAARRALDVTVHRLLHYLGAYTAVLGKVDAVVFTGGIGENDAALRAEVCRRAESLGLRLDLQVNARCKGEERRISRDGSPVAVWVIPTDEELEILRQSVGLVGRERQVSIGALLEREQARV